MTAKRDVEMIVQAWIDAGPRDLPDAIRYSIATSARALPQRAPRRFVPARWIGLAAAGAVAAAMLVVAFVLTVPRTTQPPALGPARSVVLEGIDGPVTVSYRIPEGSELVLDDTNALVGPNDNRRSLLGFTAGGPGIYGFPPLDVGYDIDSFAEGSRGIVIADATDLRLHGRNGRQLGADAATFFDVLANSEPWDVTDVSATTVDGRPAMEGRPRMVGEDLTHLDTSEGASTIIELEHPSHLIVTDVGDTRVLIQIWAGTEQELDAWLPAAMEFVDTIQLTPEP